MSEFAQKRDESSTAWVERLGRVSTSGLSDYLSFVLASWKRDADQQAAELGPAPPGARLAEAVPSIAKVAGSTARSRLPAGESTPLEAAKRAVLALSVTDLARFTFWLTHGRAADRSRGRESKLHQATQI